MATIIAQSELLRRAVAYVSDEQQCHPDKSLAALLDEAAMRFNLSPLDSECLCRLFAENGQGEPSSPL